MTGGDPHAAGGDRFEARVFPKAARARTREAIDYVAPSYSQGNVVTHPDRSEASVPGLPGEALMVNDRVVLVRALPARSLEAGDIGTVVLVHDDGEALEAEFVTLQGDTGAVATLARNDVRPIEQNEIANARPFVA